MNSEIGKCHVGIRRLGDYDLSDFSNVEFLIIDKPINTCFDLLLEKQQFEVDYFDFNNNQNNSHKDDDFFV